MDILPTIKRVKLIEKKEFIIAVFDSKEKTFIVYVVSLVSSNPNIYFFYKAQISSFKTHNTLISISFKYVKFADTFFKDLIIEFSKYIRINNHTIDLVDN